MPQEVKSAKKPYISMNCEDAVLRCVWMMLRWCDGAYASIDG